MVSEVQVFWCLRGWTREFLRGAAGGTPYNLPKDIQLQSWVEALVTAQRPP